jgi:hypothetical protein
MKQYTVTYKKEITIVIAAENIYDLDNKAKDQCPEGFILESYENKNDIPDCKIYDEWIRITNILK